MSEHALTPWCREMAQDGEYTGPGDNPPGYAGDYYETLDLEDADGRFMATCANGQIADRILRAVNSHEALVAAVKMAEMGAVALRARVTEPFASSVQALADACCVALKLVEGEGR